jgi:hypothetical protein
VDLPNGNLPSLSQRFASKTGKDPATALMGHATEELRGRGEQS